MLFPIVDGIMREYKFDYEYIFFDDGSNDGGNFEILKYMLSNTKILNYRHFINMGLGAAIVNGISYCNGDYIIILDADLSYKPADIRKMLDYLLIYPDIDCISASPYSYPHMIKESSPFIRHQGSLWFNKIYSFLLGHNITCATSMFRLYKTSVIKQMKFDSIGFDINAEILSGFILTGKKVKEIPISLYGRDYGMSKMNVLYEVRRGFEMMIKIIVKRLIK
jgi:glycosyltransferase involved in cell wall biosynthesis